MQTRPRTHRLLVVAALAGGAASLAACDVAALGTGRTDCGQLASVECREALLLAAGEIGPAPGDIVADRTCLVTDSGCAGLDWTVVYPLGEGEAIALRITGSDPNARVDVRIVTDIPAHVGARLEPGTQLLLSPPPRTPRPAA